MRKVIELVLEDQPDKQHSHVASTSNSCLFPWLHSVLGGYNLEDEISPFLPTLILARMFIPAEEIIQEQAFLEGSLQSMEEPGTISKELSSHSTAS